MRVAFFSTLAALASLASSAIVVVQVGNPTAPLASAKLKFIPEVVKVNPGDTIKFLFNGNHSVTQQANFNKCRPGPTGAGVTPFDSGIMTAGQTFTLPSSALVPGSTINYYCKINKGAHCRTPNFMQGAAVVSEVAKVAAESDSAAPAATSGLKNETKTTNVANNITSGSKNETKTTNVATSGSKNETKTTNVANNTTSESIIEVLIGKDSKTQFSPNMISATPGSTVVFKWVGDKPHNVVPSDSPQSCARSTRIETDPVMKALASGTPQTTGEHRFIVPTTGVVGDSMNFFCSVGTHCSVGKMYGTINIVASGDTKAAVANVQPTEQYANAKPTEVAFNELPVTTDNPDSTPTLAAGDENGPTSAVGIAAVALRSGASAGSAPLAMFGAAVAAFATLANM